MIESKKPLLAINISLWLEMVIAEYAFLGTGQKWEIFIPFFQFCYESETVLKIIFMVETQEVLICVNVDLFSAVSFQSLPYFYVCVLLHGWKYCSNSNRLKSRLVKAVLLCFNLDNKFNIQKYL